MMKSVIFKKANITYYINGSNKKETIVLLHGFLENSSMWKTIIDALSYKYQIISVDLLGHGKTDCLGYVHTMENMADAVFEVLKSENNNNATVIGHSMGGYDALAFAEKYENYVEGLCLLNSTSSADSEERKKVRDRSIKMAKTNYKALVSMSINNLFSSETNSLFKKEINHCKEEALKTTVQGYIACAEGMKQRKNKLSVLTSFKEKKLIIAGKKDSVINYETILKEAYTTNTPLKVVPNGHMSYIEDTEEVLKILKDFLKL